MLLIIVIKKMSIFSFSSENMFLKLVEDEIFFNYGKWQKQNKTIWKFRYVKWEVIKNVRFIPFLSPFHGKPRTTTL